VRPAGVAGGAYPARLTREGDQYLAPARSAGHPGEAVGQHSAREVPGEVAFHEARESAPLGRLGEEAAEMAADCLMQNGGLDVAASLPLPVPPSVHPPPHGDRRRCSRCARTPSGPRCQTPSRRPADARPGARTRPMHHTVSVSIAWVPAVRTLNAPARGLDGCDLVLDLRLLGPAQSRGRTSKKRAPPPTKGSW
jgi:hypothetical protein